MTDNILEAQVRYTPRVAVIELKGEINSLGDDKLHAVYNEAVSRGAGAILLNFSGVHYINTKGIALIVSILAQARKSGIRLLTCGLSEHYLEIFQITRLSDFMTIFPDEASALNQVMNDRKS